MTIFQAIVYGIVQGIGEFLPISSTAHLVLVPWLLGWKEMPASFDVALHLGTSVAVILFFFGEWISLIKNGLTRPKSSTGNLFWMLVIATIPGGLFGVALSKYADKMRNPAVIGVMLIIMGIVLYYADKNGREDVEIQDTGIKRSIAIGLSQVFAIIPGVSRSGITMTAGRAMGMKREDIAKFTFLLSTPIILGDALYHAKYYSYINKCSSIYDSNNNIRNCWMLKHQVPSQLFEEEGLRSICNIQIHIWCSSYSSIFYKRIDILKKGSDAFFYTNF